LNNGKLKNKVAVVTGAGRGIGRAIALGYVKEGAAVAAIARTESDLATLEQEVSKLGGKCVGIPADLTIPAAPAEIVNKW